MKGVGGGSQMVGNKDDRPSPLLVRHMVDRLMRRYIFIGRAGRRGVEVGRRGTGERVGSISMAVWRIRCLNRRPGEDWVAGR